MDRKTIILISDPDGLGTTTGILEIGRITGNYLAKLTLDTEPDLYA